MAAALAALAFLLGGCGEDEATGPAPPPAELTRQAVGYYCGMIVADHAGPKAQIWIADETEPVWFSSVRDALAFARLPEEPQNRRAFYVTDMARAERWEAAVPGPWIEAAEAVYVIGSRRRGGMGQMEAVPFSNPQAARAFVADHGGRVVALDEIPADYVLGGDEVEPPQPAAVPDPGEHRHPGNGG